MEHARDGARKRDVENNTGVLIKRSGESIRERNGNESTINYKRNGSIFLKLSIFIIFQQ